MANSYADIVERLTKAIKKVGDGELDEAIAYVSKVYEEGEWLSNKRFTQMNSFSGMLNTLKKERNSISYQERRTELSKITEGVQECISDCLKDIDEKFIELLRDNNCKNLHLRDIQKFKEREAGKNLKQDDKDTLKELEKILTKTGTQDPDTQKNNEAPPNVTSKDKNRKLTRIIILILFLIILFSYFKFCFERFDTPLKANDNLKSQPEAPQHTDLKATNPPVKTSSDPSSASSGVGGKDDNPASPSPASTLPDKAPAAQAKPHPAAQSNVPITQTPQRAPGNPGNTRPPSKPITVKSGKYILLPGENGILDSSKVEAYKRNHPDEILIAVPLSKAFKILDSMGLNSNPTTILTLPQKDAIKKKYGYFEIFQ